MCGMKFVPKAVVRNTADFVKNAHEKTKVSIFRVSYKKNETETIRFISFRKTTNSEELSTSLIW